MKATRVNFRNLITVRLNPGDDILLSLRKAVKDADIKNAVILEGVGSCTSHHFHVVSSSVNPPKEIYTKAEIPADIVNVNGMVINGRVHSHITFSNDKVAYGGHLEEGVKVLTFSVIVLAEIDEDLSDFDSIGEIEKFRPDL